MSKKKTWKEIADPTPESDPEDVLAPLPAGARVLSEEEHESLTKVPAEADETTEARRARLLEEDRRRLADLPRFAGVLQPEPVMTTKEQRENNPSDYHPPEETVPATSAAENPSVMRPEPVIKPVEADPRQAWLCLQPDGVRTDHPMFRSNAHLLDQAVLCPKCENMHVRKLQPGENPDDISAWEWQHLGSLERKSVVLRS